MRYTTSTPQLLERITRTPAMQRLAGVGMNCGCEYTSFPLFAQLKPYSRLAHSIGVGQIVWHHTGDRVQAVSALLHDIATPVFAHVIDFLRGDYLRQEATEDLTRTIIEQSAPISAILSDEGIAIDEVADYHLYPIADNDTPRLSADRLEYTLGNMVNFGFATAATAQSLYDDLTVGYAEQGTRELTFRSADKARQFAWLSLKCSEVYVCDADRYAMQRLAEVVREAIRVGVLRPTDLYTDEPTVIAKLQQHPDIRHQWLQFRAMNRIITPHDDTPGSRVIDAKRRCIDPFVEGQGRVSQLAPDYREALESFRRRSLLYRIEGVS